MNRPTILEAARVIHQQRGTIWHYRRLCERRENVIGVLLFAVILLSALCGCLYAWPFVRGA